MDSETSASSDVNVADPAPHIPHLLPIRLSRTTASLGCTFFIGAILTSMATLAWIFRQSAAEGKNGWLVYVFIGGFGFFGLLVLWSWFSQLLMASTPVPIVEISAQPFLIGGTARIALIQPGPAKLKSLRANLVCLEQHITRRNRSASDGGTESYRHVEEKMIHTQNLISVPFILAPAGGDWHIIEDFNIPADVPPSKDTDTHVVLWKIELWGRGPFLGSYMHPFPIEIAVAPPEKTS